jgi:hypothetical protein
MLGTGLEVFDGSGVGVAVLVGSGVLVGSSDAVEVGEGGNGEGSPKEGFVSDARMLPANGWPEYSLKLSVDRGTNDKEINPR